MSSRWTALEHGSVPTLASGSSLGWRVALVAAIILPILLFAVTVSFLLDRQDRLSIEQQLETVARAASAAVNLKLASEIATLETIAAAIDLPEGVNAPALREARRVIEAEPEWLGLRLTDPLSGRTVVHLGEGLGNEPGAVLETPKFKAGSVRRIYFGEFPEFRRFSGRRQEFPQTRRVYKTLHHVHDLHFA